MWKSESDLRAMQALQSPPTWSELKAFIAEMDSLAKCHEVQNLLCSIPGVHAVGVEGNGILVAFNQATLSEEEILKTLFKAGYLPEVSVESAEELSC